MIPDRQHNQNHLRTVQIETAIMKIISTKIIERMGEHTVALINTTNMINTMVISIRHTRVVRVQVVMEDILSHLEGSLSKLHSSDILVSDASSNTPCIQFCVLIFGVCVLSHHYKLLKQINSFFIQMQTQLVANEGETNLCHLLFEVFKIDKDEHR